MKVAILVTALKGTVTDSYKSFSPEGLDVLVS